MGIMATLNDTDTSSVNIPIVCSTPVPDECTSMEVVCGNAADELAAMSGSSVETNNTILYEAPREKNIATEDNVPATEEQVQLGDTTNCDVSLYRSKQEEDTTMVGMYGDVGGDITMYGSSIDTMSIHEDNNAAATKEQIQFMDTTSCEISLCPPRPEENTTVAIIHEDIGGDVTTLHVSQVEISSTPGKNNISATKGKSC